MKPDADTNSESEQGAFLQGSLQSNWEFATDRFNTRRLLEPIGYLPPAEFEAQYYEQVKVA